MKSSYYFILLLPITISFSYASSYNSVSEANNKRNSYTRSDRYTLVQVLAKPSQINPLATIINIRFKNNKNTIGDAIKKIVKGSGYRILYMDTKNKAWVEKILYRQPLPSSLNYLGPITIYEALRTVIGEAWRIKINEFGRTIYLLPKKEYYSSIVASNLLNNSPNDFIISFNKKVIVDINKLKNISNYISTNISNIDKIKINYPIKNSSIGKNNAQYVFDYLLSVGVNTELLALTAITNDNIKPQDVHISLLKKGHAPLTHTFKGNTEQNVKLHPDKVFVVNKGSLKANLKRFLNILGWDLQWQVYEREQQLDWQINHSYTVHYHQIDDGISQLLKPFQKIIGADLFLANRVALIQLNSNRTTKQTKSL